MFRIHFSGLQCKQLHCLILVETGFTVSCTVCIITTTKSWHPILIFPTFLDLFLPPHCVNRLWVSWQVNSRDIKQPEAKLSVMCYIILVEEVKDDPVSSSSPSGLSRGQRRKQTEMFKQNVSLSLTVSQSFPVCGLFKIKEDAAWLDRSNLHFFFTY